MYNVMHALSRNFVQIFIKVTSKANQWYITKNSNV